MTDTMQGKEGRDEELCKREAYILGPCSAAALALEAAAKKRAEGMDCEIIHAPGKWIVRVALKEAQS